MTCTEGLATVHGTLKGVIKDTNGHPIEGVKITITSMHYSAVRFLIESTTEGKFIQIGLQPDYYQIKAEKDGYIPIVFERRVGIQMTVDASFIMQEGKYQIEIPPGEEDFNRGNDMFSKNNFEEAAKYYQQAINKEENESVYYNNLAIVYTNLEKYDEAIDIYKRMLDIQSESYTANKNLGELYGMQKKYEEALPYFKKAVELSPDDPDAVYSLGACLLNTGSSSEAMEVFLKLIQSNKDYQMAYYQIGMIYVNQGKTKEAMENLEKFLELAPDNPNVPVAKKIVDYLKSQIQQK